MESFNSYSRKFCKKSIKHQSNENDSLKLCAKKTAWLRKRALLVLALSLAVSSYSPVFAEEKNVEPKFEIDQVVVTATRTEKSVKDVPYAAEIITKKEMEKLNIKRVDDALKYFTGVFVRQGKGFTGGHATVDRVTMRGFGRQNQILVLVNGRPVNNPYDNNFSMPDIPVENIERIEVIKGSASALYGSNAMGGVINIITNQKPKDETVIRMGVGEMSTFLPSISTSGHRGKWDYFLTAQGRSTDGYLNNVDANGNITNSYGNGKNGVNNEIYNARFVYHPDENNKIGLSAEKSRFNYFYSNDPFNDGYYHQENWSLDYERKFGKDHSLNFLYSKIDGTRGYSSRNLPTSTTASSYYTPYDGGFFEIQYKTRLSPKDVFILGYALRTEHAEQTSFTFNVATGVPTTNSTVIGGKTKTHSLFFQNEHKAGENTTIYLGARYDSWNFYDAYTKNTNTGWITTPTKDQSANSFNPQIGAVRKINDKASLRASVGTSFRTPTISELATTWTQGTTIYRNDPNLKPETAINYEIGLDYEFSKTLSGKLSVYHSDVKDAISRYNYTEGANTIRQLTNAGKSRINGFEIGLNKRISDSWNSFLNYTYNDAKLTEATGTLTGTALNNNYVGLQMDGVPKSIFNLGVDYSKGAWAASLTGSYVSESNSFANRLPGGRTSGPQRYESYFILNTKVSYKISDAATVSLSVDNLLDRKYYQYYLAPSRMFYAEVAYKF